MSHRYQAIFLELAENHEITSDSCLGFQSWIAIVRPNIYESWSIDRQKMVNKSFPVILVWCVQANTIRHIAIVYNGHRGYICRSLRLWGLGQSSRTLDKSCKSWQSLCEQLLPVWKNRFGNRISTYVQACKLKFTISLLLFTHSFAVKWTKLTCSPRTSMIGPQSCSKSWNIFSSWSNFVVNSWIISACSSSCFLRITSEQAIHFKIVLASASSIREIIRPYLWN